MKFPSLQLVLLTLAACFFPGYSNAGVTDDVVKLTGAHTRVVWIRDAAEISDPLGERDTSLLMGFDSKDGERPILSKPSSYFRPLITPDGKQVLFSNVLEQKIYLVNWDGSGLKVLADRAVLADVVKDLNGQVWVYAQTSAEGQEMKAEDVAALVATNNSQEKLPVIRRFPIEDPSKMEIIWDRTPAAQFQPSSNGTMASGSSGDGEGMFTLPNGKFEKFYGGCWPSMAPDGSPRMWVFTGGHKGAHVYTYDPNPKLRTSKYVAFINAPGVPSSHEMYHPRWSNHIRFLTITGPYWYKDWHWKDVNKLDPAAAAKAEIYLGKFNADLEFVEGWVKITSNDKGDFFGDAWIDLEQNPQPVWTPKPAATTTDNVPAWPGTMDGLLFIWENSIANNQIEDPKTKKLDLCNLIPKGKSLWGRFNVMEIAEGTLTAEDSRNAAILEGCRETNQFTFEAVIYPANEQQKGTLVSFGKNFSIEQNGPRLSIVLHSSNSGEKPASLELGGWIEQRGGTPLGTPLHTVITYAPGILTYYVNGGQRSIKDNIQGDLSVWEPASLIFGNNAEGTSPWSGSIDYVSISKRRLGTDEVKLRTAAIKPVVMARKPIEPLVVQAKLVKATAAPSPDSITPYRRCLSVNIYEIEKVEKGTLDAKRIMVAHWSVLDAKVVEGFTKKQVGQSYTLTLDPYDQHRELESERMVTDMEEEALPFFYDPSR